MVKHNSCNIKCKFNNATFNSNKNVIMKHLNVNVEIIVHAKKILFGILTHVFARIAIIYKSLVMIQKLCVMKLYLLWILYQQR